jgi:hypothetical protein
MAETRRYRYRDHATRTTRVLEVGDAGLAFVDRDGVARVLAWHEIEGLDHGDGTLAIRAAVGKYAFDLGRPARAAVLAARLNIRCSLAAGRAAEPQQIGQWLNVAPGEEIECRLSTRRWLLALLGLALFCYGALRFGSLGDAWYGVLMFVLPALGARRVSAGVDGLVVHSFLRRRPRLIPWAEVLTLEERLDGWTVRCERGKLRIGASARNARRLANAIDRMLYERAHGWVLPDRAPVSEAALSRMTGAAEAAERGLSVAEGHHD